METQKRVISSKERFRKLVDLGCIVCHMHFGIYTFPAIHHLTGIKYRATGKKATDEHTIGLCPLHHQYGTTDKPAIHTQPKAFIERYGTQEYLLEETNNLLEKM